jgi:hypothetical protein
MKNKTAEKINQRYAKELQKLLVLRIGVQQQEDVLMDLHYKYVQAVSDEKNWK